MDVMITPRGDCSNGPVISVRRGPLGADLTYRGAIMVHLIDGEPRPSERVLLQAIKDLRRDYPDRRMLLYQWDATDSERTLRRYLLRKDIRIILANTRLT